MIHYIVNSLINLYIIVLLVTVVSSWLIAFGIINRHNNIVDAILRFCYAVTEPVLRPIRNIMPNLGGIDLSPIIAFVLIRAIQLGLNNYVFYPAMRQGF
ncbi:YggT family protein [Parvularcula marina]|nr:YggT family protein [Parvularcula marina]